MNDPDFELQGIVAAFKRRSQHSQALYEEMEKRQMEDEEWVERTPWPPEYLNPKDKK